MKRYPYTMLPLLSILLSFCGEVSVGAPGNDSRLLGLAAISDSGSMGAEYWRLLSYAWLHAGYVHLVANCPLLWWLGRIVERRIGGLPVLGIDLGCALLGGSFIAWNATLHPKPGTSLGASTAVAGFLSCALALLHRPGAAGFGRALWVRATL